MLNQVILVGRLTRDLQVNKSKNGIKVTTIPLAIPRSFKNIEGVYETDFIDCVRDFSLFLNDHLVNQQKLFWNSFAEYDKHAKPAVLKHLAESLYQFYSGTTNNTVHYIENLLLTAKRVSFNFISFNYTTVFEEIMRTAINYNAVTGNTFVHNKNSDINLENTIHIHGKLSQDWVLGVDNLEQFSNILVIIVTLEVFN